MRRRLILAVIAALAAGPALAAEKREGEAKPATNYVDLAEMGLPVVQDGRLVNYVFVQLRLMLSPSANQLAIQAKEPFLRDALVRAAHRTPFAIPGEPNKLDEAALKRTMAAEAARVAGPGVVTQVQILRQAAQKQVLAPRKEGPAA